MDKKLILNVYFLILNIHMHINNNFSDFLNKSYLIKAKIQCILWYN